MSADRVTLDTNILFYAADTDAGERHERAQEIVRQAALEQDCFLSLQTLGELFASVTRKGKMEVGEAREAVTDYLELFPVIAAGPDTLRKAVGAVEQHSLSFWDAMQWAVARQAGARLLLSEDLQHGRELEGVHFRDPFRVDDPFAAPE